MKIKDIVVGEHYAQKRSRDAYGTHKVRVLAVGVKDARGRFGRPVGPHANAWYYAEPGAQGVAVVFINHDGSESRGDVVPASQIFGPYDEFVAEEQAREAKKRQETAALEAAQRQHRDEALDHHARIREELGLPPVTRYPSDTGALWLDLSELRAIREKFEALEADIVALRERREYV